MISHGGGCDQSSTREGLGEKDESTPIRTLLMYHHALRSEHAYAHTHTRTGRPCAHMGSEGRGPLRHCYPYYGLPVHFGSPYIYLGAPPPLLPLTIGLPYIFPPRTFTQETYLSHCYPYNAYCLHFVPVHLLRGLAHMVWIEKCRVIGAQNTR